MGPKIRLVIGAVTHFSTSGLTHSSFFLIPGPCYYVGGAQGGRTSERDENDSVIEGQYTDYQVNGLFGDDFLYSQFEEDRCDEAV